MGKVSDSETGETMENQLCSVIHGCISTHHKLGICSPANARAPATPPTNPMAHTHAWGPRPSDMVDGRGGGG